MLPLTEDLTFSESQATTKFPSLSQEGVNWYYPIMLMATAMQSNIEVPLGNQISSCPPWSLLLQGVWQLCRVCFPSVLTSRMDGLEHQYGTLYSWGLGVSWAFTKRN